MTKAQKSFLGGAAILAASGLIVKILGAIFRIPLLYIVGSESIGLFQMVYPIFTFLLVASTAGLPVAVSRMVAAEIALGNHRGAHKIFITSMKLLVGLGFVTTLIMFAGSGLISTLQGNPETVGVLQALAPSLFLVSVISAYRGYFQGMQIMTPTAISQVVEQAGKLVFGLLLAAAWIGRGPKYGATGAMVGVTLSEVAALVLLMGIYMGRRKSIIENVHANPGAKEQSTKSILTKIIRIAVPVTLGASVMPLVVMVDQLIVVNRLKPIIDQVPGIPASEFLTRNVTSIATSVYGLMSAACNTLVNFPAFISLALGVSLVPAISRAITLKDRPKVARTASIGVRTTLLLGMPSAVGLIMLAEPIIRVLYGHSLADWESVFSAWILTLLGVAVIFLTLIQSLTAILQGAGRVMLPVRNLLIGAVFKVVITYVLVGIPAWNIRGAAMGTITCYAVASILDLIGVVRYTGMVFSLRDVIIKPVIASGVMALAVWGVRSFVFARTGSWGMTLLLGMIVGIVVYGIMFFVVRALSPEDMEMVPGLNKIAKRFRRGR